MEKKQEVQEIQKNIIEEDVDINEVYKFFNEQEYLAVQKE